MEFLNLLFLLSVLVSGHLSSQLAGLEPEVVVTDIELDFPEVHIGHVGADRVQEVTVVGNHDDGVREVQDKVAQPFDGGCVQTVGRLV